MAEPKVRFKRDDGSCYPEWITKSFSESFEALNNNTFSRDMLNYSNGDAKNIHYGDILVRFGDICDIQHDCIPYVNEGLSVNKFAPLKDGDIVLADTAEDETVGKAIEIYNTRNDVVISGLHTMVCRPVDLFAPKYLGYYMNSPAFHNQLRPFMQGVKVTSIGRSNIADVELSSPVSLEEQQKIADFLSSVDEVISTSEQEVANLETQKKAVMKKIFSQEVRFKRDDGTDFPEWEEDSLGNHCTFYNGDRGKNYPSTSDYVVEGLPFINAGDLDGKRISKKCAKISEEKYNQLGGAKLVRNDILYCLRGSLGKMGIVDFDTGGTVASSLVAIRAKDVDYLYMYYFLGSPLEYEQRKVNDEGLAQPNLSAKNVGGYLMPIPCLEEQRLIADFLSDFDEAIAAAKKELELWKELKKGLLQQMFV